jgi:multisubunit Na+/H+ antiporter MnhC subunit
VPLACPLAASFVIVASGLSAWLISSRLTLPGGRALRLLAALVLWEAIQILPVHLLASLQLTRIISRVSISEAAILQFMIAGVAGTWAMRRPRQEQRAAPQAAAQPVPWYVVAAAIVLACSYVAFAANIFTSFPVGSDAVIYHLPLATRWLQDGSLALPSSGAWRFSMPGNAEIGMMILLSSGWQSAVVIASWVPAAIVATATYLLAMWISGERRGTAILCVLLVLSIPMIETQTFSAYVDLLGTAGILAAVALILASTREESILSPAVWFLSGLACGISVGTKAVYYLYAVFFCILAVGMLWIRRKAGFRELRKSIALLVLGLVLPSGFWFVRAIAKTDNPVYPMQVKIGGRIVFPGFDPSQITDPGYELNSVRSKSEWLIYPWTEWKKLTGFVKVPYGEGDGLGAAFATFVPLGIVFFAVKTISDRSRRSRNIALLISLAALALSWWVSMERVLRFGQVICVLACVLAAPLLAFLQSRRRRTFAALFVATISITSLVVASVPLHLMLGRARKHLWARSAVYNYPKLIDQMPPGSVLVNATGQNVRNFQLAGRSLGNQVITNFEAPPKAKDLSATGAGYVVQIVPGGLYPEEELSAVGATVVDDEVVPSGEDEVRWKVWKLK